MSHPILTTLDDGDVAGRARRVQAASGGGARNGSASRSRTRTGLTADFGPREKAALRDCGYTCGLSLNGSLNERPDLYEVDRINVGRHLDHAGIPGAR